MPIPRPFSFLGDLGNGNSSFLGGWGNLKVIPWVPRGISGSSAKLNKEIPLNLPNLCTKVKVYLGNHGIPSFNEGYQINESKSKRYCSGRLKYGFRRKMNLWPVEHLFQHICHHFWVGLLGTIANPMVLPPFPRIKTPNSQLRLRIVF